MAYWSELSNNEVITNRDLMDLHEQGAIATPNLWYDGPSNNPIFILDTTAGVIDPNYPIEHRSRYYIRHHAPGGSLYNSTGGWAWNTWLNKTVPLYKGHIPTNSSLTSVFMKQDLSKYYGRNSLIDDTSRPDCLGRPLSGWGPISDDTLVTKYNTYLSDQDPYNDLNPAVYAMNVGGGYIQFFGELHVTKRPMYDIQIRLVIRESGLNPQVVDMRTKNIPAGSLSSGNFMENIPYSGSAYNFEIDINRVTKDPRDLRLNY